ncbi:MAG: type II toxin-antitoxin system MqsR family toxin [Sulfuritalea sp.]|nr:type II toxin-antitoxin system MqsR family toxin [Sulfuritalea sp.]MDP1981842.1 type II toxin-antitoxin system MqsR family toxin [Sulfuritalea sp.]
MTTVKQLVAAGRIRITASAVIGGELLGFDRVAIIDVVKGLTPRDFYKSMTTHADHRIWQDVYHPATIAGSVYLKLTVMEDVLVVSFKEL